MNNNNEGVISSQNSDEKSDKKNKRGPKKKTEVLVEKVSKGNLDIFDTLREYQKYLNENQLNNDNITEFAVDKINEKNSISKISIRTGILDEFHELSLNYKLVNPNELLSVAIFEFIKKYGME